MATLLFSMKRKKNDDDGEDEMMSETMEMTSTSKTGNVHVDV